MVPALRSASAALALGLVACAPRPDGPRALSDFDRLYLVRRPPLGAVHVLDVGGESFARKLLATSLQGVVNRSRARLYLLDGDAVDNRPWETADERRSAIFWLAEYQRRHRVDPVWAGRLDEAVDRFGAEASGFVIASEVEPWTVNAATTIAAARGTLVAFRSERRLLESVGLTEIEPVVGRWSDAASCYRDLERLYRPQLDHPSLAIQAPAEYRLRDFLIQQGVLAVYGRPTTTEWGAVRELLAARPTNQPVYGYASLTGAEELGAVKAMSQAGKYLIPTDTTSNLSFHVAVVPEAEAPAQGGADAADDPPCLRGEANVVVAISDGDNLAIPLNRFAWDTFWRSPARGRLPVGWSLSLGLRALAPAAYDYYRATATPKDEWVAMLGIGYAHPSFHPDPAFFLTRTFEAMSQTGLGPYWFLDPSMFDAADPTWVALSRHAVDGRPTGVLFGYFGLGAATSFRTTRGLPVLVAGGAYEDAPADIAVRVRALLDQPPTDRPRVLFLSASVWSNSLEGLVESLSPVANQGARFLRPSAALRCVP